LRSFGLVINVRIPHQVHQPRAVRAFSLLLAFGLGGFVVPLAHQIDHWIDAADHVPAEELVLTTTNDRHLHDCSLCEVRMAAVQVDSQGAAQSTPVDLREVRAPEAVPLVSPRPFDGRAPPAKS